MRETFRQTLARFQELFGQKKWLWGVVLGVLVTSTTLTVMVGSRLNNSSNQELTAPNLPSSQDLPSNFEDLTTLTILLLGYGGAGHSGGALSDVIQVLRLDFTKGVLALISIPRDLWVSLPNGTQNKINAAYATDLNNRDPNATTAKQMAQVVTGLPVDYFIAVDFVGFQRLIGQELGGINVQVTQTMTDNWYPIKGEELNLCGLTNEEIESAHTNYSGFELEQQFPCRFETVSFPAGTVSMQGGDALKYVRSRHGNPGGDFARGVRQQEVLAAIHDKLFTLEGVTNIPRVFERFAAHTQTDLDVKLAEYLWPALKGSHNYEVVRINLSTENVLISGTSSGGASIIQPRESYSAVQNFVQSQL
ncbi:MAG TPA: LCP family protein [Patescibacteria group bacterium]|jgi:LCP family protein required for cell wall assembly